MVAVWVVDREQVEEQADTTAALHMSHKLFVVVVVAGIALHIVHRYMGLAGSLDNTGSDRS